MNTAQHTPTEREIELLELLLAAQKLGLNFDVGTAYIRRSYIDEQEKLNGRIAAIAKATGSAA